MTPPVPHQPGPELLAAVEAAYVAFAREPVPGRLNVCRCNVCFGNDKAAEDVLVRTPLRRLTAVQLAEYTNSAHGWDSQMLYFLPRYLELIAQGDHPVQTGTEYTLSRLGYVDWHAEWPSHQAEALSSFFEALIVDIAAARLSLPLQPGPDGYYAYTPLGDKLELVGHAGGSLERVLARLALLEDPTADLHIASLVIDLGPKLFDDRARWNHLGTDIERAIVSWLLLPAIRGRLEAAFYRATEPEALNTLSLAVSALEGAVAASGFTS